MKVLTSSLAFISTILLAFAISAQQTQTNDQSLDEATPTAPQLTLEEKVGQLFLIGFKGTSFDKSIRERIEKIKPGGLIFFKRNIASSMKVATLIHQIQRYNIERKRIPTFTAIDQEGGLVTRVRTSPPMPSALAMGRVTNLNLVKELGLTTGRKLKAIGFNLNLAPVLDLSDPNKFSFIGNRSFGNDPKAASAAAIQFSKGIEMAGVLSTAKHFPGHGKVNEDSHIELPVNSLSKEQLMKHEIYPYKRSIEENAISAVMMAHMSYPEIDSAYPATYSKKIIDILKSDLSFSGIVLTDDIQMSGANIYPSIGERAVEALLAGNDMIMVAWSFPDQYEAYSAVLEAVKSGRIPESRIDESFQKIYRLKNRFGLLKDPYRKPRQETVLSRAEDRALDKAIDEIFLNLADQERQKGKDLNFDLEKSSVIVYSAENSFLNYFSKAKVGRKTVLVRLRKATGFKNLELLLENGHKFVGIAHVTGPSTARIVSRIPLKLRKHFVLVNNYFLGAIDDFETFNTILDIPLRHVHMGRTLAGWFKENQEAAKSKESPSFASE